jgi:integrase
MHVNPGQIDTTPSLKKSSARARQAQPFREGTGYALRKHYKGNDLYFSGHKTMAAADKAMRQKLLAIDNNAKPAGMGAAKTTLAQAMQDYAMARLPSMKGAVQEARRMNHYLRAAGLQTLVVTPCAETKTPAVQDKKDKNPKTGQGDYFKVTLEAHTSDRKMANGLEAHRRAQLTANASTEKFRAVLAGTRMDEINRNMLQKFMNTMHREANAPATMALERSMFRVLFYYAFRTWRWSELIDNPATGLVMPAIENIRQRVMSMTEQNLLDEALSTCRDKLVAPLTTLLRETAMRSSEPLQHATWADVNWERKILVLRDSKSGCRDVPLSPIALQALRDLEPGEPTQAIVKITYEALRAAWRRGCERAGVKNLKIRDLRRTGATRIALKTGNIFLVQALTGHKTLVMTARYVNVGADDVVEVMHAPEPAAQSATQASGQPVQGAGVAALAVQESGSTPVATAPSAAPTLYSQAQMQEMVHMAVQSTLAGLQQLAPVQASKRAQLTLVPQSGPSAQAA